MSFWKLYARGWRLRCPACGEGRLFRGWFRMNQQCSHCGESFEREPGFFLGSIYFNYGLTAILVTVAFVTLNFGEIVPGDKLLWPLAAFTVLFPLWFFRYARSLWLAFDYFIDRGRRSPNAAAPPADSTANRDSSSGPAT